MDFAYNLTNIGHKVQIFNSSGTHTCTLPKGISMVYIVTISGGGGGGTSPTGVGGIGGKGGDGLVIIQCW